jgi:hypothetical protein
MIAPWITLGLLLLVLVLLGIKVEIAGPSRLRLFMRSLELLLIIGTGLIIGSETTGHSSGRLVETYTFPSGQILRNEARAQEGSNGLRYCDLTFQPSATAPREPLAVLPDLGQPPAIFLHRPTPQLLTTGPRSVLVLGPRIFLREPPRAADQPLWQELSRTMQDVYGRTLPDPQLSLYLRSFLPPGDPRLTAAPPPHRDPRGHLAAPDLHVPYVFHHFDLAQMRYTLRRTPADSGTSANSSANNSANSSANSSANNSTGPSSSSGTGTGTSNGAGSGSGSGTSSSSSSSTSSSSSSSSSSSTANSPHFPEYLVYSIPPRQSHLALDLPRTRALNKLPAPADADLQIEFSSITYPMPLGGTAFDPHQPYATAQQHPGAIELRDLPQPLRATAPTLSASTYRDHARDPAATPHHLEAQFLFLDAQPDHATLAWRPQHPPTVEIHPRTWSWAYLQLDTWHPIHSLAAHAGHPPAIVYVRLSHATTL